MRLIRQLCLLIADFNRHFVMGTEKKPMVNETEVDWREGTHAGFLARSKSLSRAAHGKQLGCSVVDVPPGNAAWPTHSHAATEEVLSLQRKQGSCGRKRSTSVDVFEVSRHPEWMFSRCSPRSPRSTGSTAGMVCQRQASRRKHRLSAGDIYT